MEISRGIARYENTAQQPKTCFGVRRDRANTSSLTAFTVFTFSSRAYTSSPLSLSRPSLLARLPLTATLSTACFFNLRLHQPSIKTREYGMLQDRRIEDVQGFFGAEPWCRRRGKRQRENEIKEKKKKFRRLYARTIKYLSRIRKVGKKRNFPVIATRKGKNVETSRYVARR